MLLGGEKETYPHAYEWMWTTKRGLFYFLRNEQAEHFMSISEKNLV